MNTNKEPLVLQAGKTYVTKGGERVKIERNTKVSSTTQYPFIGDNDCTYTENGCIFPWNEPNDLDISHELAEEQTEDCDCKDCITYAAFTEAESKVVLLDKFKFKQCTNGTKRKLIIKDYSDSAVEFIFKQKDAGTYETTGGFRLSYEAVVLLYNSLEFLLKGQERDPLEIN
jgi:hypothetical protein